MAAAKAAWGDQEREVGDVGVGVEVEEEMWRRRWSPDFERDRTAPP